MGASANFTTDSSVTDGNGHGTHVASTVGGSGAASGGLRKGVAPRTNLMVGKVLSDGGYGEDSWVLAGMVWAVNEGADVVSMSLGGDTDDGSSPLAVAINELSATSDSLFVVAAGNNGGNGPSTVTAPGSADAALTVGAVDVHDVMAGFSSRGPRFRNGALKPEVVAPGVDVTAARAAGTELGPIVDDALHHHQRYLDGHPARGRPGRDDQAAAPGLGRRADQVGRSPTAPCPWRTRPASTPAPAAWTPWTPSSRTCSPRRRCRWAPTRGPTPTSSRPARR